MFRWACTLHRGILPIHLQFNCTPKTTEHRLTHLWHTPFWQRQSLSSSLITWRFDGGDADADES